MTSAPAIPWTRIWALYLDNQSVFGKVFSTLRREGSAIDGDEAQELVHEFLVERAPAALTTFQPDKGELSGWLFVVFKRFVLGSRRASARQRQLVADFIAGTDALTLAEEPVALDIARLTTAIDALPEEQRAAMRSLLKQPAPTERAVARALGISRWRAANLLTLAIETLKEQLTKSPHLQTSTQTRSSPDSIPNGGGNQSHEPR